MEERVTHWFGIQGLSDANVFLQQKDVYENLGLSTENIEEKRF